MIGSRTLRAAVLGALVGSLAAVGMVGSAFSAPAPEAQLPNRAAIVVDTGSGPVARCVEFAGESISGLQALTAAGFSPEVQGFSGEGGAVCRLNGVGCPPGNSCLTCQAPSYWAYHRAAAGAGGYTYSSVGAGSTSVRNGDVEGWRWGTGAAPAFRSFASVCPLQPTPTTTTRPGPPPGAGGGGGGNRTPGGGAPAGGGAVDDPADDDRPGATTTTVAPTTTRPGERGPNEGGQRTDVADEDDPTVDGEEAAARSPLEDTGGAGGARTWVAFVALLSGFGLAGWRVRRIRSHTTA